MNDLTDPILRQAENIILDSSGNDYDGTLESFNSNSVWTNNDGPDNGPCINFDGNDSYIKLSNTFYKYFMVQYHLQFVAGLNLMILMEMNIYSKFIKRHQLDNTTYRKTACRS